METPKQGSSHPHAHLLHTAWWVPRDPECPWAGRRHTIKPNPCPAHLMRSRGRRCDRTSREGAHDHGEGHRRQPRRSIIDDKLPVSATARLRAPPSPAFSPAQRHPRARARRPRPARPSQHHAWRPQPAGSRLRRARRALAFTYAARRDCARTHGCCLSSSQEHSSRPPPRAAMIPGSIRMFSSRCFEWCAARAVRPPLTRTRAPAARPHPRRSAAATAPLAAVERDFCVP